MRTAIAGYRSLIRLLLIGNLTLGLVFPACGLANQGPQPNDPTPADEAQSDPQKSAAGEKRPEFRPSEAAKRKQEADPATNPIAPAKAKTADKRTEARPARNVRPSDDLPPASKATSPAEAVQKAVEAAQQSVVQEGKRLIGEVAMVLEKQSQIYFPARVDTGAQSCSIHADEIVIEDQAESMKDNVGKVARIKLRNLDDETHWVEAPIKRLVRVRTSERAELRYVVPLTLAYEGLEKEVRVTLNDRSTMAYPLLLGRNFLRGDLIVDVDLSESE